MTLSPHHLRTAVIEPCLRQMADATGQAFLASPESVAMLLGTASVESGCGLYLAQQPNNGPAFGIWQVECRASFTAQDVLRRRVFPNKALLDLWYDWTGLVEEPSTEVLSRLLMANHHACCMLARLRYYDYHAPMPDLNPPEWQENWLSAASAQWANGYWRGADRSAGEVYFRAKIAKAADVLAEVEAVRREAVG